MEILFLFIHFKFFQKKKKKSQGLHANNEVKIP